MFNGKKRAGVDVSSLIGEGTRIRGDVLFQGGLHVDGMVEGDVQAEDDSGVVTLGEGGVIRGQVKAPCIKLNGTVHGDVYASEAVELAEKARVNGNIYYKRLEMAMGAEVNGQLVHAEQAPSEGEATGAG